jgi:hypothetical protein
MPAQAKGIIADSFKWSHQLPKEVMRAERSFRFFPKAWCI